MNEKVQITIYLNQAPQEGKLISWLVRLPKASFTRATKITRTASLGMGEREAVNMALDQIQELLREL